MALAKKPEKIRIGDVVRSSEPDFALVERFESGNQLPDHPALSAGRVPQKAIGAFMRTLDRYTLADLLLSPAAFGIKPAAPMQQHFVRPARGARTG